MSTPQLSAAFASLSQSAAALRSFRFEQSAVLPRTVLSSEEFFETHLIRDAAPHELALFEPAPATTDVLPHDADEVHQMGLAHGQADDKWMAIKRKGPRRAGAGAHREKASPLKQDRRVTQAPGSGGGGDPDRCLRAAQKLLDIYTMPRAQEHVEALHSQYTGLVDTIHGLEEALRRPPSRTAPLPQHDASYYRQLELEDAIKREQLEIFALEQLKADKEAEVAVSSTSTSVSDTATARNGAPATRGRRMPSVVARTGGGSTGAARSRPRGSQPGISASASASPRATADTPPRPAPTAHSARIAQHLEATHVLASPARRPIGPEARAKARSSLLPSRPSVGTRPSLGGTAAGGGEAVLPRARPSVGARASLGGARTSLVGTANADPRSGVEKADEDDATPKPKRTLRQASSASPSPRKLAAPVPTAGNSGSPSTSKSAAPRRSLSAAGAVAGARSKRPSLPVGVTPAELSSAAETIWSTLGDVNNFKAWGRKWAREEEGGAEDKEARVGAGTSGWEETLAILRYALAKSASPDNANGGGPSSPSSHSVTSFSTSTTGGGANDGENSAPSWTAAQIVEAQLCYLLLTVLSGSSSPPLPGSASTGLPPLTLILRDSLLGSTRKTPHLGMAALKAHLGAFAKSRGWTEEMGTTAIYALVSKQTVKTDRRGREGAAVAFRVVESA